VEHDCTARSNLKAREKKVKGKEEGASLQGMFSINLSFTLGF
jgi:hypothetical protein